MAEDEWEGQEEDNLKDSAIAACGPAQQSWGDAPQQTVYCNYSLDQRRLRCMYKADCKRVRVRMQISGPVFGLFVNNRGEADMAQTKAYSRCSV